eukprot:CAMPEP_0183549666 /NCGR_PEP_ID=MMETSP0371-20130417/63693_1 /TAXON_ID=268820 /ORGANISM="Peridinium aciculiferum, Strain PAER-2" /LENGTH=139 /DNA_ID=CAMNT_0025753517 /DNA_START=102 /DNA_END=522 /DNA_ORIENTATION=+
MASSHDRVVGAGRVCLPRQLALLQQQQLQLQLQHQQSAVPRGVLPPPLGRGQRQPAAMMATARTAMASDGDRGGGPAREESSASERLQQEAAREALRDAPVGQMAGAIGEQGVGTLFSVLAVLFVVMSALTAAVLNGTS